MDTHNWLLYGHDWAVNHLRKAILHGRTRHAYLITGIDSIGKRTLAYTFAMAINAPHPDSVGNIDYDQRAAKLIMSGNHPDIVATTGDEKTGALKIEEIRAVTSKLALKPYEAKYRVAILNDFEMARPQAQDALLKTLEEPAETSVLLVLANNMENVLSTITSRCQILNLRPLSIEATRSILQQHYHVATPDADLLARVSGGRIGWAIQALAEDSPLLDDRQQALDVLEDALEKNRTGRFNVAETMGKDKLLAMPVLDLWITYWRDVILLSAGSSLPLTNIDREDRLNSLAQYMDTDAAVRALEATRNTRTTLQYTNTNPRLALEVMFLDYPGL